MPKANPGLQSIWESRLQNYHSSSLSVKKWCEEHQISVHQFKYWKDKLSSTQDMDPQKLQWAVVQACNLESSSSQQTSIVIKLKQAAIEVQSGFDPLLLREVIKTLADV